MMIDKENVFWNKGELNLQIESQETDTSKWYKKIFSGEIIKILEFSGTLNF